MDQKNRSQIDLACRTAEDFTKHYYESIDKKRHMIHRLYMDTAVLVWNGNGSTGKDAIGKFLIDLPVSEHKIGSLDAQKILESTLHKTAFLIKVSGIVTHQNKTPKTFTQTFLVTNQEDKWKIVSDVFRTQDAV